jgi:hypothetical protein
MKTRIEELKDELKATTDRFERKRKVAEINALLSLKAKENLDAEVEKHNQEVDVHNLNELRRARIILSGIADLEDEIALRHDGGAALTLRGGK